MSPKQATRLIATAFIVTVALIAWRHVRGGTAPPPSAFVYPTAMFGGLALIADVGAPGLGGVLALALTVGIGFGAFDMGLVGAGRAGARAGAGGRSPRAGTRSPTEQSRGRRPSARRINVRKG
jgi:hypothetical protein